MVKLEKFSYKFLEKSWYWLNDPEVKYLTDTPDFTEEQQKKWFDSLGSDPTYQLWGISFSEMPIGVFGIKNIQLQKGEGEYWGYIGERTYRGKGIGRIVLQSLIDYAKNKIGLLSLYLYVIEQNEIAINFYKSFDFIETGRENGKIIMQKIL